MRNTSTMSVPDVINPMIERIFKSVDFLVPPKVAKSSAVADEAVGNIRTVRAFAMEDKEKVSADPFW